MTDTKRDNNGNPVMSAASDADGNTVINIQVNPTSHSVVTDDGSSGSDFPRTTFARDNNQVPLLGGVSSSDGTTPVGLYAKSTGALKVKST